MKHVKLFEDFQQPSGPVNSAGPKTYIYHVYDTSEKNFHAEVRDTDGKVVFEIKGKTMFEGDGIMKDENDVLGLQKTLIGKNIIKQGDTVVKSKEYKDDAQPQTAAAFNTNIQI